MRRRGITDFDKVQIDPWPTGNFGRAVEEDRRIARCLSYYRENPTDNGYARPIEGVVATVDGARGEVLEVVDYGVVPDPGRDRQLLPRGPPTAPRRPPPPRDPPARGAELHRRVQPHPLAWVVDAGVDGPERRSRAPYRRLSRTGDRSAPGPPPGLDHRDGRPLRRPRDRCTAGRTPSTPASGASGGWSTPSTRLRLPGRHPYLDATFATERGDPYVVRERHLHPRGGLRHPLEAPGHARRPDRGAPVAPAGGLLHRHRGQLRVRLLLVLLPRRHHPARGQAHRDHVRPRRSPRASRARSPPPSPRAWPPPCTSTCSAPGSTSRSTGRSTRSTRSTTDPLPAGDDNPWANAFVPVARRLDSELAGPAHVDPASSRHWKFVNPAVHNRLGEPVAYKLVPGPTPTMLAAPGVERREAGGVRPLQPLGHPVSTRRAAGGRRLPQPAPRGRRAARVDGGRPARWSAPTSWPGTPSASPTSPAPRTGRSCPSSTAGSTWSRWASSTPTRPSTSLPRRPATEPPSRRPARGRARPSATVGLVAGAQAVSTSMWASRGGGWRGHRAARRSAWPA